MTEQEIKHLKKLLSNSPLQENSPELDEKILAAAKTENVKATRSFTFTSYSSFNAATIAVLLTISAFFGMSWVLRTDELSLPMVVTKFEELSPIEAKTDIPVVANTKLPTRPGEAPNYQRSIGQTKSEIIAELDLPSTAKLLEGMKFLLATDRYSAKLAINDAMSDIRSMLHDGHLNNARKRYQRLRQNCHVCSLPTTLEALALSSNSIPDST